MNPFTLDSSGSPFPLDMRGELDDTAAFKSSKKWGDLEFPLPFGRTMTSAEQHVHELDSNTGVHNSLAGSQDRLFQVVSNLHASAMLPKERSRHHCGLSSAGTGRLPGAAEIMQAA